MDHSDADGCLILIVIGILLVIFGPSGLASILKVVGILFGIIAIWFLVSPYFDKLDENNKKKEKEEQTKREQKKQEQERAKQQKQEAQLNAYYLKKAEIIQQQKELELETQKAQHEKQWVQERLQTAQLREQQRKEHEEKLRQQALAFKKRLNAAELKLNTDFQNGTTFKLPNYLKKWCFSEETENYQAINSINFANNIGRILQDKEPNPQPINKRLSGIEWLNRTFIEYNKALRHLQRNVNHIGTFDNEFVEGILKDWLSNDKISRFLNKDDWKNIKNDVKGDYGEMAVARKLINGNGNASAYLLTDVVLPHNFGEGGDKVTQIDGIYISQHGIYSIEVKTRSYIKNVAMSNDGHLVINGRKEVSGLPLLQQTNIHHSAIRSLLENSNNPQIKQMFKDLNGKSPIKNVVVIVDSNGHDDFSIDAESFNKHFIEVTGLTDLYNIVASGMNGVYIGDQQMIKQLYKLFEDNGSFNLFNGLSDVKHHGHLKSNQYEHTVFFNGCDWSGSNPQLINLNEVISDIKKLITQTTHIKWINSILEEVFDATTHKTKNVLNPWNKKKQHMAEQGILRVINDFRAQVNLPALTLNTQFRDLLNERAIEQAQNKCYEEFNIGTYSNLDDFTDTFGTIQKQTNNTLVPTETVFANKFDPYSTDKEQVQKVIDDFRDNMQAEKDEYDAIHIYHKQRSSSNNTTYDYEVIINKVHRIDDSIHQVAIGTGTYTFGGDDGDDSVNEATVVEFLYTPYDLRKKL